MIESPKGSVIAVDGYSRIDGRNAYRSQTNRLSLGAPILEANKELEAAVQVWTETPEGNQELSAELPLHQVMDLMIFLSRTLLYFREAYQMPLLYDPDHPMIERIGLQGDAMQIGICVDNPHIREDIQIFSQALSGLGELTGERLRTLTRILEELERH